MNHPYALRAPWYVLLQDNLGSFDRRAKSPAIQKYVTADFVDMLLKDPRHFAEFDENVDAWSFPVPMGFPGPGPGRLRFSTHQMIRTPIGKLYQPSHDRFYAVTVELFCDEPGLPRPGRVEGVEVRFVVRREKLVITGTNGDDVKDRCAKARELAKELAVELHKALYKNQQAAKASDIGDDDVDHVAWAQKIGGHTFTEDQRKTLKAIDAKHVVEGWTAPPGGRGKWTKVKPARLAPDEQELPMWQLPPRDGDCAAGQTRSLWFGVVPTFSADVDVNGVPKLDDQSIYRIWCFVRKLPEPGHEDCPPKLFWSEVGTGPFKLASFYDPAGTNNKRFSITMPDFRALAARAGETPPGNQPAIPGGVEVVRPPGSQLKFDQPPPGELPKTPKRLNNGELDLGAVASRCTFALELLMIVAMFIFSIFLPIVVLIFQLWWLLLLRFCWPPNAQALQILEAHLNPPNNGTIDGMTTAQQDRLDEVAEVTGAAKGLKAFAALGTDNSAAVALVASSQPDPIPKPVDPAPERVKPDPLCPPPP